MALLELEGLASGYTEVDILHDIDLCVDAGEVVTIAGTNGAGKSTLAKAAMGLMPRCRGAQRFRGHDLTPLSTERRLDAGIGYVPQTANVFAQLTVKENLAVVQGVHRRDQRAKEVLDIFPALRERRRLRAGLLSGGERQQLAFARALMSRPALLLLDEPTAALSPVLAAQVFAIVARLPSHGIAVLMVEQRARQSLEHSARGYVLDAGRIVMTGQATDLLANPDMAALYLGRH